MVPIIRFLKSKVMLLCCFCGMQAAAQDRWPKEIPFLGGGTITIYQPQPEKFNGDNLDARSAVSVRRKSGDEPVFGAMWFQAKLTTDRQSNTSTVRDVMVKQSRFGDDEHISADDFKKSVEQGFRNLQVQFSNEDLQASISREQGAANLKNDPPRIIYRDRPTTLIVLDGEPMEEKDEDLGMNRVVNTPYLMVKNPDDNKYYLYGGSFWYSSARVKDGWAHVKKLPARIKALDTKMKEEEKKASGENDTPSKFTTPTDILVVTEPAELIQTEGKPTYQSVQGSTLLYVNNSLDELFKDIDTQKNYVLLAGRWYRSASLNGPWEYVSQDALPRAFADIPAGSEKDGVLASVAGTDEAYDAVMEAQVPQTAKVDRSTARVEVNYDGGPRFAPIENTNLAVAENSNITVMRAANNRFYALENGIWFVSNDPYGPWQVANERPSDVDRIPPGSSAYNARYVYIYETTPQYVYVGYTQGYMGNYIDGPTVVWGTGWHYPAWRGRYYRPRPVTWGFGMHYNPWTGWSMSYGAGFNDAWYYYDRRRPYYGGGWFGPPAYRPPHRPWGWNGGYYGNRPDNNGPDYYANRPRPAVVINRPDRVYEKPGGGYRQPVYNNLYRDRKYVVATRDNIYRPVPRPNTGRPSTNDKIPDRSNAIRPGAGNSPGSRPDVTRPATGSGNNTFPDRTRPSVGNGQNARPDVTRPATGSGGNTFPDRTRPSDGSGQNARPDVTRPAPGSGNNTFPDRTRPSDGNGQNTRPDVTRPAPGSGNNTFPDRPRPSDGDRQNARPAISQPASPPAGSNRQPAVQPARQPEARPSIVPHQNQAPARQPNVNPSRPVERANPQQPRQPVERSNSRVRE